MLHLRFIEIRRVAGQGADDRALPRLRLPRPRLLRPRPRPAGEPRQGQARGGRRARLRARVRRQRGPAQAGHRDREGRAVADTVYLATDLDREGEAIAWHVAEAAHVRERQAAPRDVQRDHRAPIRRRSPTRAIDLNLVDAQQARRILDRLVGYKLSPLLSRKVRAGCRPGGCSRSPSAWSSSASARSTPSSPGVLDDRGRSGDGAARRQSSRRASARGSTARSSTSATATRPSATRGRSRACASAGRDRRQSKDRASAARRRRSPPPRSSRRPAASSASAQRDDVGRAAAVRGRRGGRGTVGLITYMRTDSVAMAGEAMDEARDVIAERYGEPYTCPRAARLQDEGEGRPGGPRGDPPDQLRATRTRWPKLKPRRAAPLPADLAARVASQMAGQGLETTTVELAMPADAELARQRRRGRLFDGFSRVYTEGRDDGDDDEERATAAGAAARRGDASDVRGETTSDAPALHRAAAALHRGDADQGAGGARDRPAVDLRRDDLDDRRPRLRRVEERACDPSWSARSSPTCWSSTSPTTSTSSSPPGWRRSSTRSPAASARGCRCCASSTRRSRPGRRGAGTRVAATSPPRRPTRSARSRPPDGHPARPQRAVPGLLAVPRAQGVAAAAGRGAADARGRGRDLPGVRRGHARRRTRPVRAVRRLLALPGLRLHQARGPAAARPAAVRGHCPKNNDGKLVARRARRTGNVFWGCSNYPKCDFTTITSRRRRSTTPTTARWRGRARRRSA